jgi:hypothetical protein
MEKAAAYVRQFCKEIFVDELDGRWRLVRETV